MERYSCVSLCVCLCLQLVWCQFGFFPNHREDRRYGSPFGFNHNSLLNPTRITNRLTGVIHFRPETSNSNQGFIHPFDRPPISDNRPYSYDQYGRPIVQNENKQENNEFNTNYPNQAYNINNANQGEEYNDANVNQNQPNQEYNLNIENHGEEYNGANVNQNQEYSYVNNENQFSTEKSYEIIPSITFEVPNVDDNQPSEVHNENNENTNTNKDTETGKLESSQEVSTEKTKVEQTFVFPDSEKDQSNFGDKQIEDVQKEFSTTTTTDAPSTTKLPELTPVPETERRSNFNFGTQGLFRETCQTVDSEVGSCISVLECEPYLKLLQTSQSNPTVVQLLRKAHCGFDGSNPKVCCPRPGIPTGPPPPPPPTTSTTEVPVPPEPSGKNSEPEDHLSAFPDPPVCGFSNASFSRVVGGVDAKLGDFPWMALLGYKGKRSGQSTRWLCGGSLITSRHVLTAAHCIHGRENDLYVVRLGELDLAKEDDGATPIDVPIKTKIKHRDYSSTAFTNDIGILVLEKDVQFTDLIKPICIPKSRELRALTFENYNPIIAGWGDIEFRGPAATHLQALQLPVVSNEFCAQAYSAYKFQVIDHRVLCAGYKKGGKDACQGDSGGPLMQPIWNSKEYTTHFYQIGVVSFGKKCAEAGFPGVYTRITQFVPWLEETVLGVV